MKRLLGVVLTLAAASLAAQPMGKSKIVRFAPGGPPDWSMPAGQTTKTHLYYKSANPGGPSAGIAESRPVTKDETYSVSQFIHIVEGTVTLTDKRDNRQDTFKAGDTLIIPRGTSVNWKQTVPLRQFFVEFERDAPAKPAEKPPTFMRMEIDGPAGEQLKPSATEGDAVKSYRYYGGSDRSTVAVWDTVPRHVTYKDTKIAQLMVLLRGSVTFSAADGYKEEFKAGDVMLVPKGIDYEADFQALRKFYIAFDQDPAKPTMP